MNFLKIVHPCTYRLSWSNLANRNAMKIMAFTFWLFFVLVNSFYGCVLTMFFTVPVSVPLESARDVILSFPGE